MHKVKRSIECWVFSDNRVLLLQVDGKPNEHPSFYQPITGGIEIGETPSQACCRELAEETGLRLDPSSLHVIPEAYDAVINEQLTVNKTLFYVNATSKTIVLNPKEHIGYTWSDPQMVESLLYWRSNKETWKKVIEQRLRVK